MNVPIPVAEHFDIRKNASIGAAAFELAPAHGGDMRIVGSVVIGLSIAVLANAQSSPPDFQGIYRAGGLPVQPCGRNEWMLRSFETDEFCLGSNDGFPFSEQGLANWAAFSPVDDPVLRCRETFPRTPMRGRPQRFTYRDDIIEIAYWFGGRWIPRAIHMNATQAPPGTEHSDFGYSIGAWAGDTLIVRTTHLNGGPLFNDHKPSSSESVVTERFWRAPDGVNLMMDIALDDPVNYTKPFLVNRQELIYAPDRELDPTECTPSSIWSAFDDETTDAESAVDDAP